MFSKMVLNEINNKLTDMFKSSDLSYFEAAGVVVGGLLVLGMILYLVACCAV